MEEEKVYSNSSIDIKKLLEQNYIISKFQVPKTYDGN